MAIKIENIEKIRVSDDGKFRYLVLIYLYDGTTTQLLIDNVYLNPIIGAKGIKRMAVVKAEIYLNQHKEFLVQLLNEREKSN